MSGEWGPGLSEDGGKNVMFHPGDFDFSFPEDTKEAQKQQQQQQQPQQQIVTPLAAPVLNLNVADFGTMRKFLTTPPPKGLVIRTVISRHKTGFFGKYPVFELRFDETMEVHKGLFLMCAKRQTGNKTSNYHISMDRVNFEPTSKAYMGKVRSNFLGNEYVIYDDGVSPEKAGALDRGDREIRNEVGAILYSVNVVAAQPRDMTVVLPETARAESATGMNGIIARYKVGKGGEGTFVLQQKKPKWNERTQSYNLNFHGRVKLASVKNFILLYVGQTRTESMELLANTPEGEREALLFGKLNDQDQFTMDLRWPLSPMQAFAICLSSFDPKFACE